jgi:hypothetical protein
LDCRFTLRRNPSRRWRSKSDAIFRDLPEGDDQGDEAKDETDEISILDGAPPEPPPPTNPPEPQKLSTETGWADASQFYDAVSDLHRMRGKPTGRFVGQFAPEELRAVAEFLMAVAAADDKSKAADGVATPNGKGGTPQCSKF